ncbi:winged helix-turn-helix domain-containing protein [Pseudomonas wadenswilerensis]|uniref:winged helix-turn-helix domain-containing protein n=1 Tax=Pseudomonas TaxID=286 RepID=UPI000FBF4247|nr:MULTISPECIES: winged helix-turn-helix domain-containing protein [Pseudomonas]MCE5982737.1 winged helix-turn-helix domain-containing protein [Pseudomonas sp. LF19]UVM20401.1 winged helix-turn-helix domain-containing protein [Pseudomonas wadenswilerensis]
MTAFYTPPDTVTYAFEGWRLCPDGVLWHDEQGQHLPPKERQVLRLLLANAGTLVSKDSLLDAVWPGLDTAEESLTRCICVLRKLLKDRRHFIVTVYGQGYRFTCPVQHMPNALAGCPGLPTLAILPLRGGQPLESLVLNETIKGVVRNALQRRVELLSLSVASLCATPLEAIDLIECLAPGYYLCGYCVDTDGYHQLAVELVRGHDHRIVDCRRFAGCQQQVLGQLLAFLEANFPILAADAWQSSDSHQDRRRQLS